MTAILTPTPHPRPLRRRLQMAHSLSPAWHDSRGIIANQLLVSGCYGNYRQAGLLALGCSFPAASARWAPSHLSVEPLSIHRVSSRGPPVARGLCLPLPGLRGGMGRRGLAGEGSLPATGS